VTEAYPPVPDPDDDWRLRFTRQALADLGVARDVAPDDHPAIRSQASCPQIVDKFLEHYSESLEETGAGHVNNVGGNVHKLKSGSRNRACVKLHPDLQTVWFLGFTAEHDYKLFEDRHAAGDLYPSDEELAEAIAARRAEAFEDRVGPGLRELLDRAASTPGRPARGTVGELVKVEVAVVVIQVDDEHAADAFITVKMPPAGDPSAVERWPGAQLLPVIAATCHVTYSRLDYPPQVPDGHGGMRPVDLSREAVVQLVDVDTRILGGA
jgi:hypothetical protein